MRRILKASALLSTVIFAAAAVASPPATGAIVSTQSHPAISSLLPVRIINAPNFDLNGNGIVVTPQASKIVLKLNVSERGKAQNILVVKSDNPALNGTLVDAVSRFQFRPAILDNRPIPVKMNLIVNVLN